MKLKRKSLQALALGTVMTLVTVGCTSTPQAETSSTSSASSTPATPKKAVTLKIEQFDRGKSFPPGMAVNDQAGTRYAQKNFGDPNNIKLEYVPVPRSQEVEKLNVLMASSDAPDIIFTYDEALAHKYMEQGGLMDLTSLIEQYGPNIKSYLGEALPYGQWENKQLAIPSKRAFTGITSYMIRKDWLDKLKLPVPQTTQETYETLKAFRDNQPGGQGTIPLGLALYPDEYIPLVMALIKDPTEEQYYTGMQRLGLQEFPILMDGHKDVIRTLNQWYHEGLISPDFGLDKDQKMRKQGVSTGKIGLYSEQAAQSYEDPEGGQAVTLAKNVPGGFVVPANPFTNDKGRRVKELNPPTGMYIMVPKTSKAAAEAVQYLNWLAQMPVMLYYTFNGSEGKAYEMKDGVPVKIKQELSPEETIVNSSDILIVTNGLDFGQQQSNVKSLGASYAPNLVEHAMKAFEYSLTDAKTVHYFPKPIAAETKYAQILKGKYEELLVKSMLAKPADFDKTYDDMLKQYMASGGADVQKERVAAYAAMKK
ncbi:extracellular solute-binding protein [Paenibacillus oryzisoli]|uniref:extracellular solute-binding protein n=1 Tax=Paenibacillus oryzisoli TaxID=1850517 RepID=UPI003D2E2D1C